MASKRTRERRKRHYLSKKQREDQIAERVLHARYDGVSEGRSAERKRCDDERTLRIDPYTRREGAQTDPVFLNDTPKRDMIEVCVNARPHLQALTADNMYERVSPYEFQSMSVARFHAQRMCWQAAGGQTVIWYHWEFRGIQ